MSIYKTQGIILRRKNFFEADRLLTIYTRDYGKIKVVAKGSRKILSKLGGHLELFYLVDLMLAEGKSLDIITSIQTIESYKYIRKNKKLINCAYYVSELIDLAVGEEDKIPEIFELLIEVLNNLNCYSKTMTKESFTSVLLAESNISFKNNSKTFYPVQDDKLLRYFELKLISILGHYPEVSTCVACKKGLKYKCHGFSYIKGGIVCVGCNNFDLNKISPETIKLMRLIPQKNLEFINRVKVDERILNELEKINQEILDHILEREIKSKSFL